MLYKPFCSIPFDIGAFNEEIIANQEQIKNTNTPQHVDNKPYEPLHISQENNVDEMQTHNPMDLNEWKFLSLLHLTNNIQIIDLNMLSCHDIENNHNQNATTIPYNL